MNKSAVVILTLSLSLFTFINAQETKVEDKGKTLAKKHCAECHGEVGNSTADKTGVVPNIAGFSAILLFDTLYQFKYEDRESLSYKDKNNKLMDMKAVSKKLTEDEAQTIALYYAQQTFSPLRKQGNKALAT